MIGEGRISGWRVFFSVIVGLGLAIVPMPRWMEILRPDFLLIFVIYWALTAPRMAGMTFAWMCGFAIDVLRGLVLGQHAFAFLAAAYLTHRWQLRMRIFPIWQQASAVFVILFVYHGFVWWIDGIIDAAANSWVRWLPLLTGTLLWPFVVATMDTWNRGRRR
jgi:rod shape-determining protein MreD